MKKYIILAILIVAFGWFILGNLIIMSDAYASVSKFQVQKVFNKLQKKSHTNYHLSFSNSNSYIYSPNASSSMQGIEVNSDMLRYLQNSDEIALVLGHELGHLYNKDVTKLTGSYRQEYDADKYGTYLLMKSGYNRCKSLNFFKRSMKIWGNSTNPSHPQDSLRFNALSYGCN